MQPISDHFTNVPAFLTKLWKMVSDSKTDHLICWSPNGNSFIILNQVQFWYELLPLYYKHNNMSSFVRQLNMYGFHKVTSVENGPLADGEKDEVQFFHPYFQKGSPELLKLIKRKVTVSKHSDNGNQVMKNEDLSKVLLDVKQLRGRQASVDSQLAAMKQENAVLWRELAVLRQKHSKQQQIVNKLIQFLVSMVHPGGNRMGVGVKRHYPLMLRGTPSKRTKKNVKSKNDGPTIHELDNEIEVENEIEQEELLTASDSEERGLRLFADNGEEDASNELLTEAEIPILNILEDDIINNSKQEGDGTKVFINPSSQDTLLSNLTNGVYNVKVVKGNNEQAQSSSMKSSIEVDEPDENVVANNNMTVATRNTEGAGKINNSGDLGSILDTTQSELDLYKDLLHGCGTFDTNSLLGLFNEGTSEYGLSFSTDEINQNSGDPMVSGQEVATYPLLPLEELLDDSLNNTDLVDEIIEDDLSQELNTPQISDDKPTFPTNRS